MKLSELLTDDRILWPLEAGHLKAAAEALVDLLVREGALDEEAGLEVVRELLTDEGGDLIRVNEAVLVGAVEAPQLDGLTMVLGVSPTPFRVDPRRWKGESTLARCLILLLTPRRLSTVRAQAIPTLVRFFRLPERTRALLQADPTDERPEVPGLDTVEIHDRLLVEDALTPLRYRIYPDTPMEEVVDLMVRRGLHAVPIVGENHEVLGILTSGDALEHLLPRQLRGEEEDQGPLTARDVMTRSVLCVSEDQPLAEAAHTMLNKDVAQLPVVREGELVGFLTRETVLRQLFGR